VEWIALNTLKSGKKKLNTQERARGQENEVEERII
jgi:hypothetical protein